MSEEIVIKDNDRTRVRFVIGPREFEVIVSIRHAVVRIEAEGQIQVEPLAGNAVAIREWRP